MTFPYQALLFDLDGVLVDSEVLANRVWVELLAQHGLHFTHTDFLARSVGVSLKNLYAGLKSDFDWSPPEGFEASSDAAMMTSFAEVQQLPGALQTLAALQAQGIPFAVASNSRRDRLDLKLAAAGLSAAVEHRYDPADVAGRGKPLPDLYLHAARQLGADIRRCLVIEDSPPGVRAGVAAGATVWGILGGGHVHDALGGQLLEAGASRLVAGHPELQERLGLLSPTSLPSVP